MTMNTLGTPDTTGGTTGAAAQPRAETVAGRGRHRRPRSRSPLFTAAGLALVAGALSLARLLPDPDAGGMGMAGQGSLPTSDRATPVDEDARPAAHTRPSASSAEGADDARLSPGFEVDRDTASRTAAAAAVVPADGTTGPGIGVGTGTDPLAALPVLSSAASAPSAPRDSGTAADAAPVRPAESVRPPLPDPEPAPPQPATPPPPQEEAGEPGLCVPLIGVCVGLGTGNHR